MYTISLIKNNKILIEYWEIPDSLRTTIENEIGYKTYTWSCCNWQKKNQIKDRIKKLMAKAKDKKQNKEGDYFKIVEEGEIIYEIYKVAWKMIGGKGCPFNIEYWNNIEDTEASICSKTDGYDITIIKYNINNPKNKERIRLPVILLHLIRAHSFYGGPGTTHRLEPSYLVSFLNLNSKVKL